MKMTYTLTAPCHFGLEAVLKREITNLGYEIKAVDNGKVSFLGDAEAIARANLWLRTAERVLLEIGRFRATSYEELFQGTLALPFGDFLPKDGKFWVTKATSVDSKLFSPSDIQSVMKKAMVRSMERYYGAVPFLENGESFPFRVSIQKDMVTVSLDTSGISLHKRGYRTETARAPITETLAAALLLLTPWHADRILADPFCGSGTFLIEAAMMASNMAPGMNREFLSQTWEHLIPKKVWYRSFDEVQELLIPHPETDLQGFDIDGSVIRRAKINAEQAGVSELIHFQERDVSQFSHAKKYGFIVTNPPYGARLMGESGEEAEVAALYRTLGERFRALQDWSLYLITAFPDAEKCIGRKADKNRKIYNGMMKTYFYQFLGKKPPKREKRQEKQGE